MNATEREYRERFLQPRLLSGEIVAIYFERFTLTLGDNCRYTPDFCVIEKDGEMVFHEVKGGYAYEDARVKFKAAQEQFKDFTFLWCQKKNKIWEVSK